MYKYIMVLPSMYAAVNRDACIQIHEAVVEFLGYNISLASFLSGKQTKWTFMNTIKWRMHSIALPKIPPFGVRTCERTIGSTDSGTAEIAWTPVVDCNELNAAIWRISGSIVWKLKKAHLKQ